MNRFALLAAALLILPTACTALTPPPMVLGHGAPRAAPVGATDLRVGAVAGAGIITEDIYAGGLRVHRQIAEELALGAQIDAGGISGDDRRHPLGGAGRLFSHWHPRGAGDTRFAFGIGGGGSDSGLRYGTLDASLFVGTGSDLRIYGGPVLALAFPFEQGGTIHDEHASTSGDFLLAGGLEVPLGEAFAWSFELTTGGAGTREEGAFLLGGGTCLRLRLPAS